MSKLRGKASYFNVSRSYEIDGGKGNCFKLKATVDGKDAVFHVCVTGASGNKPSLHIRRGGRRGGAISSQKVTGGMVVCDNKGQNSKCIRGTNVSVFPGGGAKLRRGGIAVLNGYLKKRRK